MRCGVTQVANIFSEPIRRRQSGSVLLRLECSYFLVLISVVGCVAALSPGIARNHT